ncbi:MAG TPA: heavy-metal-associated domain-containing protein [Caulobacteraceae bacterium]|jgi:copper chaperone
MTLIKVEGMTCGHCAGRVKQAVVGAAPGAGVDVDVAAGEVRINGGEINEEAVRAAIREAGYQPV